MSEGNEFYVYNGIHFRQLLEKFPGNELTPETNLELAKVLDYQNCEGDSSCDWTGHFVLAEFLVKFPNTKSAGDAVEEMNTRLNTFFVSDVSDPFSDWAAVTAPVNYVEHRSLVEKYDSCLPESLPPAIKVKAYKRIAWYSLGYKNISRATELYLYIVREAPSDPDIPSIKKILAKIESTSNT